MIMKNWINLVIKKAEENGWSVNVDGNEFCFSKYSPAGQDFNIEVEVESLDDLIREIDNCYENYDCSEEAYLWLDNTGHGKNGAPYDMKDVYEDMEACEKMIREMQESLEEIKEDEEDE